MPYMIAPSVNVCILRGTKILLSRRANTGWRDGDLCLPGGHVEDGERPTLAMVREIQEELGVTVKETDIEFLCVAARNKEPVSYVAYEFVLRDKDYDYKNAEPERCSELVWVDMQHLPDDVIEDFQMVIEQGLVQGSRYLELGFKPKA